MDISSSTKTASLWDGIRLAGSAFSLFSAEPYGLDEPAEPNEHLSGLEEGELYQALLDESDELLDTGGLTEIPLENLAEGPVSIAPESVEVFSKYCQLLNDTNSLSLLLEKALPLLSDLLHVKFCQILVMGQEGRYISRTSSTLTHHLAAYQNPSTHAAAQSLYRYVNVQKNPVILGPSRLLEIMLRYNNVSGIDRLCLIPLQVNDQPVGILAYGDQSQFYTPMLAGVHLRFAVLLANHLASAVSRAQLAYRLQESKMQTVIALTKAMELRNASIAAHCRKVAAVSLRLARKMDCREDEVQEIRLAAILHDIGKMSLSDGVMHSTGPLTADEWEEMRCHAQVGAEIVQAASHLEGVARLIWMHHERMDGKGYPQELAGGEIPIGARILSVANAFSAMTSQRSYRPVYNLEEALAELRRHAGTQFDPVIVDAFVSLYS